MNLRHNFNNGLLLLICLAPLWLLVSVRPAHGAAAQAAVGTYKWTAQGSNDLIHWTSFSSVYRTNAACRISWTPSTNGADILVPSYPTYFKAQFYRLQRTP